jgi:hypothetical protein
MKGELLFDQDLVGRVEEVVASAPADSGDDYLRPPEFSDDHAPVALV